MSRILSLASQAQGCCMMTLANPRFSTLWFDHRECKTDFICKVLAPICNLLQISCQGCHKPDVAAAVRIVVRAELGLSKDQVGWCIIGSVALTTVAQAVCWMALRPKDPCRPNYKRKITKAKMRNSPELWAMSAESAIPVFQCGFVVRSLLFRQQQARSASIRFDNYPNACSIAQLLAASTTPVSILPFAFIDGRFKCVPAHVNAENT